MDRHVRHVIPIVENLLYALPVVHIGIEHGNFDERTPSTWAAIAALLRKQKPPAASALAWRPGGRQSA